MSKVIPISKDPIKNLSDTKFSEIEKDLNDFFYEAIRRNSGDIPVFEAKEYAIKAIAEKHNFTIEQAKDFVFETQMRKVDRELSDQSET